MVTVEIFIVWIYWTKAFRITIDREVVYEEGDWARSARSH
jgi:hypothetical protein